MDALLASYGADDDDDDVGAEEPRQSTAAAGGATAATAAPAAGNVAPLATPRPRPSLFASLPPPASAAMAAARSSAPLAGRHGAEALEQPQARTAVSGPARPSLFGVLPPPRQAAPQVSQKRKVVPFRPPGSAAEPLAGNDEDDGWRPGKHPREQPPAPAAEAPAVERSSAKTGLAALLPAPKHSLGVGSALGGGAVPGSRRTVMESSSAAHPEVLLEGRPLPPGQAAVLATAQGPADLAHTRVLPGHMSPAQHCDGSSSYQAGAPRETVQPPREGQYAEAGEQPSGPAQNEPQAHYPPEVYAQYHGGAVGQAQDFDLGPSPSDPLQQAMAQEKRKGKDGPAHIVEVKQAELTKVTPRQELQAPAYGPTYQSIATSAKDKPSKLHRRKHQITSLYFDMRQKEMEVAEQRARGHMTKAQTHAKYGW
eukprot:SM000011S19126  [mRNA]  locus=s11:1037940:1039410:+ [translate_table: standard]